MRDQTIKEPQILCPVCLAAKTEWNLFETDSTGFDSGGAAV